MSTADDPFEAGAEDGRQVPLDDETARAIARNVGGDLKQQDSKDDSGDTAA